MIIKKMKNQQKALVESGAKMLKQKKCFKPDGDDWVATDEATTKEDCDTLKYCYAVNAADCTGEGFSKRTVPSSKPARVDGEDDEVDDVDRIDYAKTLEQAYDNLQGMLGTNGIKGLTSETSRLVEQQTNLMESLKTMGPMIKQAKSMMAGMKDINGLESIKDMKSIVKTLGKK